ncbi:sporulation initiation inhibitor Soj (plasmid) [Fulvitalea axinellae]|uniref:Sporulation initiation inhibitor Soj n=1 Tax=Fulvitalea axinellae TaxID=1182444 RepID=A0AAU9DKG0_9BACT|nr:sporulation initiation inhibitor Soj [Fulvitalea axinellae]
MGKVIAIVNHKGGVGKTTTTANLGKALSLAGEKVLLVDIDPQGNLSQTFGIENPDRQVVDALVEGGKLPEELVCENLCLAPSGLELVDAETSLANEITGFAKLRKALRPIRDSYDYILIDCPPSLNILSQNAIVSSDSVLIPVEPTYYASNGLERILNVIEDIREEINDSLEVEGLVFTMVDGRLAIQKHIREEVRSSFEDLDIFNTEIRRNVTLQESSSQRQDVFSYDAKSRGATDYRSLAEEVRRG